MQQYPVWLFDFDGTLVDSEQLILASFRHATDVVLGATPPDDELRAGIGLTLEAQARHLAGDRADQLFEVYVEHNRAAHRELLRTFAGVPEMIGRLRARGARLGVVTAKIRPTMELGFEHVPLEPGSGDTEWLAGVDVLVEAVTEFEPSALVVSLGVDSAADDLESPLQVTAAGYTRAAERLAGLGLPTVHVQEGGYHLASLGGLVAAFLWAWAS